MAEFPGGMVAFQRKIAQNIKYPQLAREQNIQGKVYVRFIIDVYGRMTDIEIARSVDPLLDAEAIRMIKELAKKHKWKPATRRGKPVEIFYTVPVNFVL